MAKYIYQYKNWPNFTWDEKAISQIFGEVRNLQGRIFAYVKSVGFSSKEETNLNTLTLDVLKSSEIEGEKLDFQQVRSSIARKLGITIVNPIAANRNVEGVVEMMLDATQSYKEPLSHERLFAWHASLFPTGYSGLYKIEVARYRTGEMQIVSGAFGKEKVHFEAIPAKHLTEEMNLFISWFNENQTIDPVIKAAIAHFWFIIIHPFDDGNGRIARALTDLLLARSDDSTERFYSMSNQILIERKKYYTILNQEQHSDCDITNWLSWFLNCLKNSLVSTENSFSTILKKSEFWKIHENTSLNERQRFMLNKLLDEFNGKLNSSKWAKMTKCSQDTALRDIKDLIEKGILMQEEKGGRSTNYILHL